MMFSPKYNSFNEWLSNFHGSESYKNRIIREHKKYPRATLSQLRGHPKRKEKLLSKPRKKSPIRLVIVQGNIVSKDKTETAADVYSESYVRIADRNIDNFIHKIFDELDRKGLKIYRSDNTENRINISLTGEKKGKIISQKYAEQETIEKVIKEMHPAKKFGLSHHKKGETRSGIHENYRRGYEEE